MTRKIEFWLNKATDEDVKRVARAMQDCGWLPEIDWQKMARAAIEAMGYKIETTK